MIDNNNRRSIIRAEEELKKADAAFRKAYENLEREKDAAARREAIYREWAETITRSMAEEKPDAGAALKEALDGLAARVGRKNELKETIKEAIRESRCF